MGQTRRALLLLAPAAVAYAQATAPTAPDSAAIPGPDGEDVRLPNGTRRQDAILKADYDKDLKDARDLVELAKSFEEDLEREDRWVLSVNTLKKLDNMESMIRRIRGRLKKN